MRGGGEGAGIERGGRASYGGGGWSCQYPLPTVWVAIKRWVVRGGGSSVGRSKVVPVMIDRNRGAVTLLQLSLYNAGGGDIPHCHR